ncbi:MAG: 1-deoxy-D-xylulose-5-phosphate reductoisomerase [Alphaproteobacteria bacterium]
MTTRAIDMHAAPRRVTILGSTGSVGCNTVDLIEHRPERFVVEALTANRNAQVLAEQAKRLRPSLAVVADPDSYGEIKEALAGTGIEVAAGAAAVIEAASRPADLVMAAIVGAAGFEPTLAAARRGAIVALANKETLVCAGELVMATIEQYGATLLPVDSEHSAIFQVFDFEQSDQVERIILTASGGPFRTYEREAMARVTRAEAVAHPNWDMGAKISVDSATMMNKGLEVLEAHHLFPVSEKQIEIVIHPESVVHSMVAYVDGSVLAQLGRPDMRTPIAYALSWPERMSTPAERLDFAKLGQLTFEPPDTERFPALRLAREALKCGGCAPTILNAANEVAVHGFLEDRVGFLDIARIVERALETAPQIKISNVGDVREVDANAREIASDLVRSCTSSR